MVRGGIASGKSRLAVALVIFALLAFTTIRTSPLTTGLEPGASLSKTTPKQRHLSVREMDWTLPLVSSPTIVLFDSHDDVPAKLVHAYCNQFWGHYFSLPPPA